VKQQSRCLITTAVAGPCQQCGKYQREQMHVVDGKAYCGDCCHECRVSHEWTELVQPVNGEQMDLSVLLEGND